MFSRDIFRLKFSTQHNARTKLKTKKETTKWHKPATILMRHTKTKDDWPISLRDRDLEHILPNMALK